MSGFLNLKMEQLKKHVKKKLIKRRSYELLNLFSFVIIMILSIFYIEFDIFFIIMTLYYGINYFVNVTDYNFVSCQIDNQFIRINYFNRFGDLKQAVFPTTTKILIVKDTQFFKKKHFIKIDKEKGFQLFDVFDENSIITIPEQFLKG